jgi:hypothetical protein
MILVGRMATPCPRCSSATVIKNSRDDTLRQVSKYRRQRFGDLTGIIFAGHYWSLRAWIA